jgi:hypothetical protein
MQEARDNRPSVYEKVSLLSAIEAFSLLGSKIFRQALTLLAGLSSGLFLGVGFRPRGQGRLVEGAG